jgi:DNA-binding winged helix-turn-helix (wHTH) protein
VPRREESRSGNVRKRFDSMALQFGEFRLDPGSRQLLRGTEEIHLPPRTFRLLEVLLESAPKAISKDELMRRIWPDVVVEAGNLKTIVSELRDALGDTSKPIRFIRTVHRFGYAFSGDVRPTPTLQQGEVWQIVTDAGTRFILGAGDGVIGRDPSCAVWIDSPEVSRHHARVRIVDHRAMLEDLGSKNGTWVRGVRVAGPVELCDGDSLALGTLAFVIRVHRAEESTRTAGDAAR